MKRIWIDFKEPWGRTTRFLQWTAFASGSLLLIASLLYYKKEQATLTASLWLQANVMATAEGDALAGVNSKDQQHSTDELTHANLVLKKLNLPWSTLFNSIEKTANSNISIMTVSASPENLTLKIGAAAKNYNAALDFIDRLNSTNTFSKVFLTNEKVNDNNEDYPVRILVSAEWKLIK